MAKLVFPGVGAPYRGFIGELRGWLRTVASYVERQPGAATAINTQLAVIAAKTGYVSALPNTQAIVTNGGKLAASGSGAVATVVVDPTTKVVTVTLGAS